MSMRRIIGSVRGRLGSRARGWLAPPALLLLFASVALQPHTAAGATMQDPPFPDSTQVRQPIEEVPGGEGELAPTPEEEATPNEIPDTLQTAPVETPIKPGAEAALDTLRLPSPQPTGGAAAPAARQPQPAAAPAPPKQRVGVLGIHPAAILIGLGVLTYFITKWATD
jgi:hypothetical protein